MPVLLALALLVTPALAAELPEPQPLPAVPSVPERGPWTETDQKLQNAKNLRFAGTVLTVVGALPAVAGGGMAAAWVLETTGPCNQPTGCGSESGFFVVLAGLIAAAGAPFLIAGIPMTVVGHRRVVRLRPTVEASGSGMGLGVVVEF